MNGLCFKQKNEEKERFYKQIKVQSFLLSSALVLEVDFLFSVCAFFPLLDALNRIFNETKMFVQLKRFFLSGIICLTARIKLYGFCDYARS